MKNKRWPYLGSQKQINNILQGLFICYSILSSLLITDVEKVVVEFQFTLRLLQLFNYRNLPDYP